MMATTTMIETKLLKDLYDSICTSIELSGQLQSTNNLDLSFAFRTTPGFPPPEVTQSAVLQQTEDFIMITETLLKCHQALIIARRELLMIGTHNIGKGQIGE